MQRVFLECCTQQFTSSTVACPKSCTVTVWDSVDKFIDDGE